MKQLLALACCLLALTAIPRPGIGVSARAEKPQSDAADCVQQHPTAYGATYADFTCPTGHPAANWFNEHKAQLFAAWAGAGSPESFTLHLWLWHKAEAEGPDEVRFTYSTGEETGGVADSRQIQGGEPGEDCTLYALTLRVEMGTVVQLSTATRCAS